MSAANSKTKYCHAFDFSFEVVSSNSAEMVTKEELFAALQARIDSLKTKGDEILEACGHAPHDTYEMEE